MPARILAAADIGSNTAHLLVAATDGDIVMRIDNMNEWISLGEVVARTGTIPKEYIDQLIGALKEFRRVAVDKRANAIYVFATEAMRAAKNHRDVLKRIKQDTGIAVEIIPPEREAEFSFIGIRLDTREIEADMLFEVGGGSVQLAVVDGPKIVEEISLPMGTGRIIAESGMSSPCTDESLEKARSYIHPLLKDCDLHPGSSPNVVASGGVARGLWRALHPDGEKKLHKEEIEYLIWSTQRLSTERIIERFNVKPKRAGTLLPGALVYHALMERFETDEVIVSEFGVREGAVLEMAKGNIKGQQP